MKSKNIVFVSLLLLIFFNSVASIQESNYDDYIHSFEELQDLMNTPRFAAYMEESGYIKGKGLELTASVIGADYGERYTISSGSSKIYVELYEYKDTSSKLALKVLSEAQSSGTFSLYNDLSTENTAAAVTPDGKYLMLYTDSSTGENNVQTKNDAVEAVKNYGK